MAWDPYNVQRWKHKVGFHNSGVLWNTPMARWAGEGNDWMKLAAQRKPRKEDVIRSLLESMKQVVEKKAEPKGTRPKKKPWDLPPLELDMSEAGQRPTLEIRGDCKTIVDWINGHAKLKTRECTMAKTQNLLRDWWAEGSHTSPVNTINQMMHGLEKAQKTCGSICGHCPSLVVRGHRSLWVLGWQL